ncbi:membrane protein insertion efficiency factor YidD [Pseudonocardia phyllosphaerae]|uniref:membrane protein insertion efficiency factor YidD n=1 Tax=Pseudonocardia phyllosphaerae TaxID=3390502 RepID=UPI00397E3D56
MTTSSSRGARTSTAHVPARADGLPPDTRPDLSAGARGAIAAVRWYQRWISSATLPACRFQPSCSAYAVDAYAVHGLVRGTALTAWRLLRCGPWHPGGADPVPPRRPHADRSSTEPVPNEGL